MSDITLSTINPTEAADACCDVSPGMMSIEAAIQLMLANIQLHKSKTDAKVETIGIEQSVGRVLAIPVVSPINVPGYDNSAMDGYALRAKDLESKDTLEKIGTAYAGQPFDGEVSEGQCIRIMTGAPMPVGADTVVMQEKAEASDEVIRFLTQPKDGDNVRRAGEDIANGKEVFPAGREIRTVDIGLLSSIGIENVEVLKKISIAVFSTGDELRLPGQPLDEGCIYDSNRFVVKAMLSKLSVDVIDLGIVPDQPEKLERTFITAIEQADAVISTGGVSVGEADYTLDILKKLGQVGFWKVAMKPGKPFAFGELTHPTSKETAFFFGLPGNPVSATVTFDQLALPAISALKGMTPKEPVKLRLPTATSLKKRPGRADFQRATLQYNEDGQLQVHSTGKQGSGILTSMSVGDCYIVLPVESGSIEAGEMVEVRLFGEWLK